MRSGQKIAGCGNAADVKGRAKFGGQMNARAYHRILTLARTIADSAGCDKIETAHIAEVVQYRPRKQAWVLK